MKKPRVVPGDKGRIVGVMFGDEPPNIGGDIGVCGLGALGGDLMLWEIAVIAAELLLGEPDTAQGRKDETRCEQSSLSGGR